MTEEKTKKIEKHSDLIFLFDVDGTLTKPRNKITDDMFDFMQSIRKDYTVGIVGGSDYKKQIHQLGDTLIEEYDYVFSENGLYSFKDGKFLAKESISDHFANEELQPFINFCLKYMAELDIPCKRGTFIEWRTGLINLCPVGRNCSQKERDEFEQFDIKNNIRKKFVQVLQEKFGEKLGLSFAIGGQISIDVFPKGWDKTFCIPFLEKDGFKTIHFFGDKTYKGGNDYEIYEDKRTIGHAVKSPAETKAIVQEIIKKLDN